MESCPSPFIPFFLGLAITSGLLVPLLLMGKVVAILYVEGGAQELSASLPELKRIVVKASMAFEILILRTKILAT